MEGRQQAEEQPSCEIAASWLGPCCKVGSLVSVGVSVMMDE